MDMWLQAEGCIRGQLQVASFRYLEKQELGTGAALPYLLPLKSRGISTPPLEGEPVRLLFVPEPGTSVGCNVDCFIAKGEDKAQTRCHYSF